MSTVEILDVGHGNCSLVSTKGEYAIVDAPRRNPLSSLLRDRGITRINAIIVSHADADHLAGVQSLLYDDEIIVERLYVNPEQTRTSGVWASFKVAAAQACRNGTKILSATRDAAELIAISSEVELEIVSPTGANVLAGPGGKIGRTTYTANRLSVVVRVLHDSIDRSGPFACRHGRTRFRRNHLGWHEYQGGCSCLSAPRGTQWRRPFCIS